MEGTVVLKGKISYASQDPWVFSGTVRDNILFGSHFDESWYHTVVEACALSKVVYLMMLISHNIHMGIYLLFLAGHKAASTRRLHACGGKGCDPKWGSEVQGQLSQGSLPQSSGLSLG